MLTKWFGTRTARLSAQDRFVRPTLEVLEDRLPPSSVHGEGASPSIVNIHNNIHITDSSGASVLASSFNGQNLGLLAAPQSNLQGLFTTLYTQASKTNPTAANALVSDEAQLAIDAYLTFEGVADLSSNISSLQSAIASNSLESSSVGVLLGQVTFDLVLSSLVSQPAASTTS